MSRRLDDIVVALGCLAIFIVLVGLPAWIWLKAPCGLWKFSAVAELPVRCL